MTDREKLFNLSKQIVVPYFADQIANHLIAHGVVFVVRCEECKYKHNMIGCVYRYCEIHNTNVYADDFCSCGERRAADD